MMNPRWRHRDVQGDHRCLVSPVRPQCRSESARRLAVQLALKPQTAKAVYEGFQFRRRIAKTSWGIARRRTSFRCHRAAPVTSMKWRLERGGLWLRRPSEPSFVSLAAKPVGKPDAGNPHVRFDERGWETGRRSSVSARAHPRLYKLHRNGPVWVPLLQKAYYPRLSKILVEDYVRQSGAELILYAIRKGGHQLKAVRLFAAACDAGARSRRLPAR
jgi:hypothetical protein